MTKAWIAAMAITTAAIATARAPDLLGRPIDAVGSPAAIHAVEATNFRGRIVAARGESIVMRAEFGDQQDRTKPEDIGLYGRDMIWPWASVTKQVVATMVMQQVDAERIKLDLPASRYLPQFGATASPSVRQLLQHQSGLRNPDNSPVDTLTYAWKGRPGFYSIGPTGLGWCLKGRGKPGGEWRYNNCDYIVLGTMLEQVTGQPLPQLFQRNVARPAGLKSTAFADDRAAPRGVVANGYSASPRTDEVRILARFGAAGALLGTESDLLAYDRALLAGKLMRPASRDEMWRGDGRLGFMALGQWSFAAPLKGCAKPVRIIERRGAIGRYESRNILLPDLDLALVAFTDRPDFDFGEIWQGKGLSYDLLSALACG